ncbi:MAG: thermonuclease family protein [Chloracidobacterium sp.]|nr:thermonuclease family protein [Chloracidobacterium sp.]
MRNEIKCVFLLFVVLGLATSGCSRSGRWKEPHESSTRRISDTSSTPQLATSATPVVKPNLNENNEGDILPKPTQPGKFHYEGKVVGIIDGDTIDVLDSENQSHRIRLAGIDAPESRQDFGSQSKAHLSSLIFGKTVLVDGNKQDRYGRQVAKILLMAEDINLAQISAGFAWHYKRYEKEQSPHDLKLYSEAELAAKAGKVGIWSLPNPIPPWEFR